MEVQVDITKQDLTDFNRHHIAYSPAVNGQVLLLVFAGFCWIAFWLYLAITRTQPGQALWFIALMVAFPLWAFVRVLRWRRSFPKLIEEHLAKDENQGACGPQKIILSSDTVTEKDETSQVSVAWKDVKQVVATDNALYIYFEELKAIIAPKRCFPSERAFEAFVEAVKNYKAQAIR